MNSPSADSFLRAAAAFTLGGGNSALHAMKTILAPHKTDNWPVVTYLPFLWHPDSQMILKPESTVDFAQRVGHRLANDYTPEFRQDVYDNLLDLVKTTDTAISDLHP